MCIYVYIWCVYMCICIYGVCIYVYIYVCVYNMCIVFKFFLMSCIVDHHSSKQEDLSRETAWLSAEDISTCGRGEEKQGGEKGTEGKGECH